MNYQNIIVEDNNTAVVGITIFDKKVLFLKRKKPPLNWCPPCGRVEFNESLEDALIREIKEETSLDIQKFKFVSYWEGKHLEKAIKSYLYVCFASSGVVILSPSEHSEYKWVDLKDLNDWKNRTDFDLNDWKKWIKESLF